MLVIRDETGEVRLGSGEVRPGSGEVRPGSGASVYPSCSSGTGRSPSAPSSGGLRPAPSQRRHPGKRSKETIEPSRNNTGCSRGCHSPRGKDSHRCPRVTSTHRSESVMDYSFNIKHILLDVHKLCQTQNTLVHFTMKYCVFLLIINNVVLIVSGVVL